MSKPHTIEFDHNGEMIQLPTKLIVCPRCEGEGMHLNPSIGDHCYTSDEFENEFSEEEQQAYFTRGGMFDIKCLECEGLRVVPVLDRKACDPAVLAAWDEQEELDRQYEAERASERRYGA